MAIINSTVQRSKYLVIR